MKTIMKMRMRKAASRAICMRRAGGSAALELAIGSLITITVVAFALNTCFAMLAYGINDRACRDAARAAAQGGTQLEAFNMAKTAVKSYNSTTGMLSAIAVSSFQYNDFAGNPPENVSPFVTVVTSGSVQLPAVLKVFGKNIFNPSIPIKKSYTFPIVRLTVPND